MSVEAASPCTEFLAETNPLVTKVLALLRQARNQPAELGHEVLESLLQHLHRIRGAACFLGFLNVERLSTSIEGALTLLATHEISSSLTLIDGLIEAAEVLERLLEDIERADDLDILNQVEFLHLLTDGKISDARIQGLETRISVTERLSGEPLGHEFWTTSFELERAANGGLRLFFVELDLMADYQDQGKHLLDLVSDLTRFGLILDSGADLSTVGTLEDCFLPKHMPLFVLLASRDEPDSIREHWGLSEERLSEARNPLAK
jgi:HPt (histidine-containing phosphotransfer) domain-containing protein